MFAILCNGNEQTSGDFEALIKAGNYSQARAELQTYIQAHPASWEAFYQLGYADFRLHYAQESLTALCKSILLKPDFAESHKILAFDLNLLARPDLARGELSRAIHLDPLSSESYYELGRIDFEQGLYSDAITELEKAKALNPESVRVYHNLGLAYAAAGNNDAAISNFELGLKLNAKQARLSVWPLIDYATYLNSRQEFERARNLLVRAEAIDPSWDQEFDELAKAYRGLGRMNEAVSALQKAIVLNPRKADLHYVLSRLLSQLGRDPEAKAELSEYLSQRNAISK